MIVKTFEINKKKIDKLNFFLVYGENEGLKKEIIQNLKENLDGNIDNYDEAQILVDKELFYEKIFNQSLYEKEKIIIVNRCSEKIYDVIENILEKNISDTKIILNANILEKKSKLRNLFEKDKKLIIIPTYRDTSLGLLEIARKFFTNYKISISQEAINLLVSRCNGDRGHLKSELDKVLTYMHGRKNINLEEIYKLTNLSENFSINELVDNSLSKNYQKASEIINDSNYKLEDGMIILRTFLQRPKRLLNIYEKQDNTVNFDSLINDYKPPIFWKDKPIVKKQLENWSKTKIKELINNINKTETYLKKNSSIGLMLVFNFIYETSDKN
jgi:DNA polymerase-3 subunit delta